MKITRPPLAGVTPQIVLTSVVLPAPFGPINPRTSPLLTASVTSRRACRPVKCLETASSRRISDMFCLPPEHAGTQRDQAVGEKQQEHDDQSAKTAAMDLDVIAPDHFPEPKIEKRATDSAERRPKPAHQRHHDGLHRVENVEHVGGVDIM